MAVLTVRVRGTHAVVVVVVVVVAAAAVVVVVVDVYVTAIA